MKIDNNTKIYTGSTPVEKIYAGSTIIYEKVSYTELEYLESTGTQYIDTLFSATINTKIEVDYQYTNNTTNGKTRIFGSRKDWNLNGFYAGTHEDRTTANYWYLVGDILYNRWHQASQAANKNKHNLILSKAGAVLDGTTIWVPDDVVTSFTPFATIALFGAFEADGGTTTTLKTGVEKIYKCKIYDNDILIRDFIPVLDNNNEPCLYDKVSNTFFYNQGSGTFLYG